MGIYPGNGPGQFDLPHSVDIDRNRRVYVADRANSRIQVFDENGKYLDQWPTGLSQALFGACTSFRLIRMAIFMWLKIMADGTRNTTRNRAPTPTS